jgi:homoserine dehydrogenase
MISGDEPLSTVSGVFNAVEVLGEPIGRVMFYGPGAGAGATASAVVGDLMQVMRSGRSVKEPLMMKGEAPLDFDTFRCRTYLAVEGATTESLQSVFGKIRTISEGKEIAFITGDMCEAEMEERLDALLSNGAKINSRIRLL